MNEYQRQFLTENLPKILDVRANHPEMICILTKSVRTFITFMDYVDDHPGLSYEELGDDLNMHPFTCRTYSSILENCPVSRVEKKDRPNTKKTGRPNKIVVVATDDEEE